MSQVNVWVGLERACVERYSGHTGLPTGKNLRKMKRSSRQRHYWAISNLPLVSLCRSAI